MGGGNERGAGRRLRRVSHHVGRRAAFPSAVAGPAVPEAYHLAELAPSDAADCVGLMPGVDMWRTSIEDAARSWGYRVRGGASELVACAFLYAAAGDSPSAGHCTVSNVLTSKDHRRRGLAKSLMLELLRAANGRPTSLYASEMGAPLYKQLGFKTIDTVKGFRCERQFDPETRAAGVAVSVTAAPTAAEIADVGALDSAMFGGNRMALLQTALGCGSDATLAVARDASGKVSAFAASTGPNAFSQGARAYGPVVAITAAGALAVIVAVIVADQSAAAELLPVVLTVRSAQHSFIAGLLGLGFEEVAREGSPCMLVNADDLPGKRGMYFALHASGSG